MRLCRSVASLPAKRGRRDMTEEQSSSEAAAEPDAPESPVIEPAKLHAVAAAQAKSEPQTEPDMPLLRIEGVVNYNFNLESINVTVEYIKKYL